MRIAVIGILLLAGLYMRVWFVTHVVLNSDSAVVGLMARNILHGHTYAFYWGQAYGGVEPYVVAAVFWVFGISAVSLASTTVVLAACSSFIAWKIARRLVSDPYLALLAGALVWCATEVEVLSSSTEYGFRGVTLLAGLTMLLFALRILDNSDRRYLDIIGLGLAFGIGWWSSPEIAYYGVPTILLLVDAAVLDFRKRGAVSGWILAVGRWVPRVGTFLIAAVVGSLPWLWPNVSDGFMSLKTSSLGQPPPGQRFDYFGRLGLAFHHAFPLELGVQRYGTGTSTFGSPLSQVLWGISIAITVAAIVLAILRGGRAIAFAVAVLAFPFIYAFSPATWFWESGRYAVFLPSFVVFVLVIGCAQLPTAISSIAARFQGLVHNRPVDPPPPNLGFIPIGTGNPLRGSWPVWR